MKLTNIALHSNNLEVANFSFRDPGATNPYLARAIVGLDAAEIVPKFYGSSALSNRKYYTSVLGEREIVVRIELKPEFSLGKTYSDLRDDLYRAISSSRTSTVQLRFNNNYATLATIEGFVTKFEAPHFNETPEVQLTIKCTDSMLRSPDPVELDVFQLTTSNTIDSPYSTAPHGFTFEIELTLATPSLLIQESAEPEWSFEVIPGLIDGDTGFLIGDVIHFSSEADSNDIYIVRDSTIIHLVDKIQPGSVWPFLFPGANDLEIDAGPGWFWKNLSYYSAYWGV